MMQRGHTPQSRRRCELFDEPYKFCYTSAVSEVGG